MVKKPFNKSVVCARLYSAVSGADRRLTVPGRDALWAPHQLTRRWRSGRRGTFTRRVWALSIRSRGPRYRYWADISAGSGRVLPGDYCLHQADAYTKLQVKVIASSPPQRESKASAGHGNTSVLPVPGVLARFPGEVIIISRKWLYRNQYGHYRYHAADRTRSQRLLVGTWVDAPVFIGLLGAVIDWYRHSRSPLVAYTSPTSTAFFILIGVSEHRRS